MGDRSSYGEVMRQHSSGREERETDNEVQKGYAGPVFLTHEEACDQQQERIRSVA